MTARIILHLPRRMIEGFHTGREPLLYGAIKASLAARGAGVDLVEGFDGTGYAPDGNLHIVENGRAHKAGVLNAATAYLERFFHVDPIGIQAASGIGSLSYHPDTIDGIVAQTYLAALQQRFVLPRHSRYKQIRTVTELPAGAIAVFLQGPAPQRNGQAFCSYQAMLETVCEGAQGRAVVVKAHPLQPELGQAIIAAVRARGHRLIETAANVHDILAACDVTVSVNSAASIEGFLHGKPAVLFGKSDYHHLASTAHSPADFPKALADALAHPPNYARALYWYFGQNCLDITDETFDPRLLAIFAKAGFDADRLGLRR